MPGKIGKLLYWQGPSTQSSSIISINVTPVHSLRLAESILHSCQVAPSKVPTTKGGLSAAMAQLLAQPPVPLQLSYVEADTEFEMLPVPCRR